MSRSAYSRCCRTSYPPPLGYLYAFHPATSANAATSAAATTLASKLEEQVAVARDGDGAVGLPLDPCAAAGSHRLEVVPAVVRVPDRTRKQFGPCRRDDDATVDRFDHLRGLALGVRRHYHRSSYREDAVEPARHDVARQPRREPNDVDVRGRERLGQQMS